jgi:hypothetical protein
MRAGCISYAQHVALGDNGVATPEMLQHPCPLPNQYTIVANDTAKTDLLNPLWSPCTTSATTGSNTFDFFRYESLLDAAGPSKETLAVREIFPRCLDFAGVDVGQLHHIPCGINKQFMLYSTSSQSLLVPAYTGALLQSFSTSALAAAIGQRIEQLRDRFLQPRFPQFPTLTVAQCSPPPVINADGTAVAPQLCDFGKYGPNCGLSSQIAPTSLTTSPTTLTLDSHSHIQWEFLGDNSQELTLVLQRGPNTGSGYFAWSQVLGTVPVANLYASAQVPSLSTSLLFRAVYGALDAGNTDFTVFMVHRHQLLFAGTLHVVQHKTWHLIRPKPLPILHLTFQ